jgi:two-component system, OmpR family, sensor histidine kinase MtrB
VTDTAAPAAGTVVAGTPADAPGAAAGEDGRREQMPTRRRWRNHFRSGFDTLNGYRVPLRRRILLTFALGSFALSAFLAATTYSFTKSALLNERDNSAIESAYENAKLVRNALLSDSPSAEIFRQIDNSAVLNQGEVWSASDSEFGRTSIPLELRARVTVDQVPAHMVTTINGEPVGIVGIPIPDRDANYFEFSELVDTQQTLRSVGRSLLAAAVVTTGLGVLLGSLAARRSVRPLADAAQAAKAIAGGRLDTRLEPNDDPDLRLLSTSFNDMAAALQQRVERDARFASDVSHELRSPLMTLSASAEVLQARRDDLPEKSRAALDLLVADVARFQGLVEDLLEISRFDAGAIRLHLEDLLLAELVRQSVSVSSVPDAEVTVTERGECLVIRADKRRLARAIANLIDNARFYGAGDVTVEVSEALGDQGPVAHAWIAVEDHGPGVPAEERSIVFERFARGASAGRRSSSEGAGLGLALVDEHVRMHSGRVWVEDRRDGATGARFVIELPADEVGM